MQCMLAVCFVYYPNGNKVICTYIGFSVIGTAAYFVILL